MLGTGEFSENFWTHAKASSGDQIKKWKEALECVSDKMGGLSLKDKSSEADFVKEVKRVIVAIGLEEEEDNRLGKKGESLRIAFSMYDCFSIITKCWDVDMNQRLSFLEILKKIENIKKNLPSDQWG